MSASSWLTTPRRFLSLLMLPVLVGCASAKDTPQQEYVWAMGRICDARSNTWYLDKVDPDGSYTVRGASNSVPDLTCRISIA